MESDLDQILKSWRLWTGVGVTATIGLLMLGKRYFLGARCHSRATLHGKTAIVTGANGGLGFETALDFAKRGARVIIGCRNMQSGQEAVNQIISQSGNPNVTVMQLDLASLGSVRGFCDQFLSEESRCDILVNNAGVMACPKGSTLDGFEYQLGVNHLGHFLLTTLLLDLIKESQPSRIVVVTGKVATFKSAQLDFDDMQLDKDYVPWNAYGRSKLCNILFTVELAKRLEGSGVTVNCCHPGIVMTNLSRHVGIPPVIKCLSYPFLWYFLKSPFFGAQTQIFLSVEPSVENISGLYFSDCEAVRNLPDKCTNAEAAARLWSLSEEMVQ
ncbi:retinol dehydrogenase 14-like [Convolutriloba macropyga]|uniref:retinol dehydrogenase 14-like n=1 Tax=Convolutriloba macropyga TaxID=536237 RepID=UPI003F51DAF4